MRRLDRTSLVAGVVIVITGIVLLLDRLDEIDLRFGYGLPLLIATRRGDPARRGPRRPA